MSRFEAQQISEGRGWFISALALAAALSWGVISLFTVNTDCEGEYRHKTGRNDAYEGLSDRNIPDFEALCNTSSIHTS